MFQVGDRVRIINLPDNCSFRNRRCTNCFIGAKGIYGKHNDFQFGEGVEIHCSRLTRQYLKIGGTMRYDELKERIEQVQAWDKEADDILQEIGIHHSILFGQDISGDDYIGHGSIDVQARGYQCQGDNVSHFNYATQCEKLGAFRKALMWLLDHSDIKKEELTEEKRRSLQSQMDKLKEQMKEIEKELKI